MGQKIWVPSLRDTKKMSSQSSGLRAAWSAAAPGLAMGPGGRPGVVYVLYGCGVFRSLRVPLGTVVEVIAAAAPSRTPEGALRIL